jgi:hypothetical protein
MLRLSDLSGSRLVEGFEIYYCGYPVPSSSSYVLSKTWYANEMDRPGSVWTHVLFLDRDMIGQLPSLHHLMPLFKRPNSRKSFKEYGQAISLAFEDNDTWSTITSFSDSQFAGALIAALYGHDKPVVLEAADASEFFSIPFQLWAQQPPLARSRFTFCTGALGAMYYGDSPFSLQFMPKRAARTLSGKFSVLPETAGAVEKWARLLAEDLPALGDTPLRRFTKDYFEVERDQFGFWPSGRNIEKLTKIFLETWEDSTIGSASSVVQLIVEHFPDPHSGSLLKRAVLDRRFPPGASLNVSRLAILKCIVDQSNAHAFDSETLGLSARASSIWTSDCSEAAQLFVELLKQPATSTSKEIMEGLIDGIPLDAILKASHVLGLPGVSTIATRRVDLVSSPDFWRLNLPWEWHSEIAENLFGSGNGHEVLSGILAADRKDLLLQLLRRNPFSVTSELLETIDARGNGDIECAIPTSQVAELLVPYADAVHSWIGKRKEHFTTPSVELLALLLNPDDPVVLTSTTVDEWNAVLQLQQPQSSRTHLVSFILALALQNISQRGFELAEQVFHEVHSAAEKQRIGYENWSLVRPFLPELSWSINWDKCERLRRGLCLAYLKYPWPAISFLNCARTRSDFQSLLASCEAVEGGNDLIEDLIRTKHETVVPDFKRDLLERISSKRQ